MGHVLASFAAPHLDVRGGEELGIRHLDVHAVGDGVNGGMASALPHQETSTAPYENER